MGEKFGVGIVGPGWVAGEHADAYEMHPKTRMVAVSGRDEAHAQKFIDAKGLNSVQAFGDYEKMLAHPEVDIVSICTPNYRHAEEGILAAQAGKHMLLEKPAAITLDSLHALNEAVEKAGVTVQVGFEIHWYPIGKLLKSLMKSKSIGNLFYTEIDYRSGMLKSFYPGFDWSTKVSEGGSSFLVAGCHAIDLMVNLVGSKAVEVTAYSGGWDDDYEYDATIVAIIKFENGVVGKSLSSIELNMPYGFNVELYGDQGTIINNEIYSLSMMGGQEDFATIPTTRPGTSDVSEHPFLDEVAHLVECIENKTPPLGNMRDSVHVHEICIAADTSAAENRPVSLPLR
jgi:predicted dehydrogenase